MVARTWYFWYVLGPFVSLEKENIAANQHNNYLDFDKGIFPLMEGLFQNKPGPHLQGTSVH